MKAIPLILLLCSMIFFFLATYSIRKLGLPSSKVIYADKSQWESVQKPLFDPDLGLTGKPDYLALDKGKVIPVEVKSTRGVSQPYTSHVMQLLAYCLLVNHEFREFPPYGIIHYPDKTFTIRFSAQQKQELLKLLEQIRNRSSQSQVSRSHKSSQRCRHCGFRDQCDQALL